MGEVESLLPLDDLAGKLASLGVFAELPPKAAMDVSAISFTFLVLPIWARPCRCCDDDDGSASGSMDRQIPPSPQVELYPEPDRSHSGGLPGATAGRRPAARARCQPLQQAQPQQYPLRQGAGSQVRRHGTAWQAPRRRWHRLSAKMGDGWQGRGPCGMAAVGWSSWPDSDNMDK